MDSSNQFENTGVKVADTSGHKEYYLFRYRGDQFYVWDEINAWKSNSYRCLMNLDVKFMEDDVYTSSSK